MENHRDIPPEYYGRWWKVVNDEFGEIVNDEDNAADSAETERREETREDELQTPEATYNQGASTSLATGQESSTTQSVPHSTQIEGLPERPTAQEADLLADYLSYGLSLREAREAHKKEQELADLKHRMRENKRAIQRGAVNTRGSTTHIGPANNTSGRGRGLSFN